MLHQTRPKSKDEPSMVIMKTLPSSHGLVAGSSELRVDIKFTRRKSHLFFVVICTLLSLVHHVSSQFISHINQRGMRGNVTFDIRPDLDNKRKNSSILEVEALIEVDRARWIQGEHNEDEFDSSQVILFDWTLHTHSIEPNMLQRCLKDDLGPQVGDDFLKSLPEQKPIQLDTLNRWSIPVEKSARDLSSLIWSRSIRLKLAKFHEEKAGLESVGTKQDKPSRNDEDKQTSSRPVVSAKPALSRPQLAFTSPSSGSTPQPGKPTFAPRPKPNISAKYNKHLNTSSSPAPSRPRQKRDSLSLPQSLPQLDQSNHTLGSGNTSTPASPARDSVVKSTHRRILKLYSDVVVCGNIIDVRNVKTAQAVFESQIAGRINIRSNEDDVTVILANLYHIRSKVTTRHEWKIMASDILDSRREDERCKYLQTVFDPNNLGSSDPATLYSCDRNNTEQCRMGDLAKKHGPVQVAGQGRSARMQVVDLNLPLSALEGSRSLFLVIFEVAAKTGANGLPAARQNILSCASITSVPARHLEANINMDGVRGSVKFSQRYPSEPTSISYDLFGLEGNTRQLLIRELPMSKRTSSDNAKICSDLGEIYGGQKLGNLTARHGHLTVIDSDYEDHYMGDWVDMNLQLFGMQTIAGRSLAIYKNNGDEWVCSTIELIDEATNFAVARFHYPVVGKVIFWQPAGDPFAPTGVLVDVYNPNNDKNVTEGHNWLVHIKPAMGDFYNWSARCESTGEVFDPILASVGLNNDAYSRQCTGGLLNEPLRCRLGDTSLKSNIKLILPKAPNDRVRQYYADPYLPLSGSNSILGRSLVIYDEFAPAQRGDRLACSTIKSVHSLKASVRSWDSGPSIPSSVSGSVVFEQAAADKQTRVKLDLSGFNGNVENYAIHQAWLTDDREFPCSNDSLYEIYDPFSTEHSSRLPPAAHYGSSATVDRVKVGDLSRKHGSLDGLQSVQRQYRDNNLPLFAPNSIVGRSIVLRAAVNDFRWVCGNIELDYDKGSSREIVAVASFDEPRSKVGGYVRFFQLEHKDGSLSDTFVQVDLKLQPGSGWSAPHSTLGSEMASSYSSPELRQSSEGHNWAVFVNQVGEDAFISADEVRCIAAGFKWNPYLAQDTSETYSTVACTPVDHDACAIGDLGQRHGALRLGLDSRRTLSDSNLPLVGNFSVMGRSLVIFDNKRPNIKLACANIVPDMHLKSNVVIKQTPSFTVTRFVEQMRSLLGAAEWLMVPELRATKSVANGECVQMTIHFYGQRAHQMQVELNNLITLGSVRRSGRTGVDKISTHYRMCRAGQSQLVSRAAGSQDLSCWTSINVSLIVFALIVVCFSHDRRAI